MSEPVTVGPDAPAVLAAIVDVNKIVAALGIAKADKNEAQNFSFRGVDRVYEAMAGPMAEHGLFSTSDVLSVERAEKQFRNSSGTAVYVTVRYTFWCATDGSSVSTTVVAEAMDSGDKATAKAMSVAHRTALLQLSTAPVNPTEADAETYELAPPAPPVPVSAGFLSDDEAKAAHNEAAALWRTLPEDLRPEIPKLWPSTREGLDAFNAQINAALATALGASESADGPDTPPESPGAQSGASGEPELPPAGSRHVDTPDIGTVGANGNESDPKIAKLRVEMEVSTMSAPAIIAELEAVGLSPSGPPPKLKQRLVEHRLSVLAND